MKILPTLSAAGWVAGTHEKLDFALSHFFIAEQNQSYSYADEIADVHAVVARSQRDPTILINDIQRTLGKYLKSLFDEATVVAINFTDKDEFKSGRYGIKITIQVRDDGNVVESAKLASFEFNKFKQIIDVNNYGNR